MRKVFTNKLNKLSWKSYLALIASSLLLVSSCWLFFGQKNTYHEEVSVNFTESELPYVFVNLESEQYPMMLDLGSRLEMEIHSNIAQRFNIQKSGEEEWKNYRGTKFKNPKYVLSRLTIGSLNFRNLDLVVTQPEEDEEYCIWKPDDTKQELPETVGHLGRSLLKKVNLLFDMPVSKLIISNNRSKLRKDGYNLRTFLKVPFTLTKKGIIINVETDLGKMKLLLDMGFTLTMLHDFLYPADVEKKFDKRGFPICNTNKFIFNQTDFGNKRLYFLEMTEELHEIDGFLGMDFISEHVMYIDFQEKCIYIKPS